jgi:hypothetical protein
MKVEVKDRAIIIDDAINADDISLLKNLVFKYAQDKFDEALEASKTDKDFYHFLGMNDLYENNLSFEEKTALDKCHDILFKILKIRTSFPKLEKEFYGISISSNHSMAYHADAERPFCRNESHMGSPNDSDNLNFKNPLKNEWEPNHTPNRVYTSLVYLNDDFIGGETTLPIKEIHVRPFPGKLFGFPCSRDYIHGVRPAKNGVRLAFTAWYVYSKDLYSDYKDSYGKDTQDVCPPRKINSFYIK